jgi:hypothetical protein
MNAAFYIKNVQRKQKYEEQTQEFFEVASLPELMKNSEEEKRGE